MLLSIAFVLFDNFRIDDKGNGETTLQIISAKLADGGWYQCDATNESGISSLKVIFQLSI